MDASSIKKRLSPWNIAGFTLGLLLLVFLLRQINLQQLLQLVGSIQPAYLLLGGLLYFAKAVVRSLRFMRVNQSIPSHFMRMLRLTFATSLASQVLPLKIGELSYVYLLNKDYRASVPTGLSSLLVIRLVDLLSISLLFIAITLGVGIPADLAVYFRAILVFMAVLLVMIVGLLLLPGRDLRFLSAIPRPGPLAEWEHKPLVQKVMHGIQNFLAGLEQYRATQYLEWTGLGCLEWLINYAAFYVLLLGIGMQVTFFATVVCVTFAALASVLPLNSFGSFGPMEAGWATGLVLMGYPPDIAITSGFATHLLTLGYMLVFGGLSWVSYYFGPWNKPVLQA
jgi:glycosyltransferase 2 family protein